MSPQYSDDALLAYVDLAITEKHSLYKCSQMFRLPITEDVHAIQEGSENEESRNDLIHYQVVGAVDYQLTLMQASKISRLWKKEQLYIPV